VAGQVHVRNEPAAVADYDVGIDDAIGADGNVLADRGTGLDSRGWIYHGFKTGTAMAQVPHRVAAQHRACNAIARAQ
jgi:hypothetical protein